MSQPDPQDDFAKVELFRWQHGELPQPNDKRRLDAPVAIMAMSKAIESACKGGKGPMPSPMGVCSVLEYCSRHIAQPKKE